MWLLNSVAGVLVVVGLISAGLSTLESLIQSLLQLQQI
jgi:hypothetical protein